MAHRGGKRPGAGRPAGSRNRATRDNKATLSTLARLHTESALAALAEIVAEGRSEAARIAAACAILDRGYGRPRQTAEAAEAEPLPPVVVKMVAVRPQRRED